MILIMKRNIRPIVFLIVLLCVLLGIAFTNKKHVPSYGETIKFKSTYDCLQPRSDVGIIDAICIGAFHYGRQVYEIDNTDYYRTHHGFSIEGDTYEVTGVVQPPRNQKYVSDGVIVITDLKVVK